MAEPAGGISRETESKRRPASQPHIVGGSVSLAVAEKAEQDAGLAVTAAGGQLERLAGQNARHKHQSEQAFHAAS